MKLLLIALALVSGVVSASADPNQQAAAHYKQGKAFLDAKQYDQAIVEFKAAYAIDKVPSHLFNIAKAYDAKADYDAAIEHYQKYLDAEPKSPRAAEVRGLIAVATQARQDAIAKKQAEAAAAEKEKMKVLASARVKQAEAFAQAGAWVDAGKEHKEAFAIDADPAHLIAAAEAFVKAPDLAAARDAYIAYLDKVPQGGDSDSVRKKLAETTTAIEKAKADEAERLRKAQEQAERERRERELVAVKPEPKIEYDTTARDARRSIAIKLIVPGGIVTVVGLAIGFKALSDKRKAEDNGCDKALVCNDDGIQKLADAKKFSRVADVALGLGLAATITGLIVLGNAPKPVEKVRVTPAAGPSSVGVTVSGSF